MSVFTFLLDVCEQNAYALYKISMYPKETVMALLEFKRRIFEAMVAPVVAQNTGLVMLPAPDAKGSDINDDAEEEGAEEQKPVAVHMLLPIPGYEQKRCYLYCVPLVEEKHERCRSVCGLCDLVVLQLFITAPHCPKSTHPYVHNCTRPEVIGKMVLRVRCASYADGIPTFPLLHQKEEHAVVVEESDDDVQEISDSDA